jgi:hypothetical protein
MIRPVDEMALGGMDGVAERRNARGAGAESVGTP